MPRKPLIECDPRWLSSGNTGREKIGIVFDAPMDNGSTVTLAVGFMNPEDGLPPDEVITVDDDGRPTYWRRAGETFETLTLSPSIWCKSIPWHGFIENGTVRTV